MTVLLTLTETRRGFLPILVVGGEALPGFTKVLRGPEVQAYVRSAKRLARATGYGFILRTRITSPRGEEIVRRCV